MLKVQYISSSLAIGSQYEKSADLLIHDLHHATLKRCSRDKHMELVMRRHHGHIEQSTPTYLGQLVERSVIEKFAELHVYMLLIRATDIIEIVNGIRLEEWGDIGDSNALEFKNQIGELELVAINVHNMGRQWPQIVSNNTTFKYQSCEHHGF